MTTQPARRAVLWGIAASVMAVSLPLRDARGAPSAAEILERCDAIRNPPKPFSLLVSLTEYRAGAPGEGMSLQVYSKAETASGQYRSLVQFVRPERDQGKLMMKTGNILWFHDPGSGSTVRISPQQRLLGQASNGDVVTVNLSKDYAAVLSAEEVVVDADRKERKTWKLDLKATNPDVTYPRIEYWVEQDSFRPVRGRFYSDTDRLLKTAFYRGFEEQLGAQRPTETIIIDGVDTKLVTRMKFSRYAFRDIPEAWFQKDSLARFRPE